jgi:transcriptional regulator with XRE-family HTH domain
VNLTHNDVPEAEDVVYQRLTLVVNSLENGNQAEFARRIGVRSGVVGDMFGKRRNKPSFDVLAKIVSAYPQLRVKWLLLGEGEMLESAIPPNTSSLHSAQADAEAHVVSGTLSVHDHIEESLLAGYTAPLPDFDRDLIDKRFLAELARLRTANVFHTYAIWAQAVGVNPNYVAAIEKGRYHFNIELLYNTVRLFPAFDFIYVMFGSAWSNRPEPTELPKRTRGPRPKVDN